MENVGATAGNLNRTGKTQMPWVHRALSSARGSLNKSKVVKVLAIGIGLMEILGWGMLTWIVLMSVSRWVGSSVASWSVIQMIVVAGLFGVATFFISVYGAAFAEAAYNKIRVEKDRRK